MKRTIIARTRFLRVLMLFIAASFSFGQLYAQITVTTIVPTGQSEALNVGVGTASYSVTIENKGNSSTNIASLVLNQPVGISLVSATASIGTVQYAAIVVDNNTIGLNIDLPPGQTLTVLYLKKADCAAVPNGTSNFSILVSDNITINNSLGAKQVATNSYPLLFPSLKVTALNDKAVQWRLPFSDSISVINSPQAGKAKNMLLSMKWAITGALRVNSMAIQKAGGPPINITNIITQGDSATINIDSTALALMGFVDGIFNPTDSFKVLLSATPLMYSAKLQTIYTMFYLADGKSCQRLSNAMGVIDYDQQYPEPVVAMSESVHSFANLCNQDFNATYTLTNTGAVNTANDMMNVYVTAESFQNAQLMSVMVNGTAVVPVDDKYYIGASDLNGDGLHNDLAANESVSFSVLIRPTNFAGTTFSNIFAHTCRSSLISYRSSIKCSFISLTI